MSSPIAVRVAPLEAVVSISVADAERAASIAGAVARALEAGVRPAPPPIRVVRLRTRKRMQALGADGVAGAIVVIRVTEGNARRLRELVDGVRPTAAAVQLVWDGDTPSRPRVERPIFEVLEHARSTPAAAPVVLARDAEPALALRLIVRDRSKEPS